MSQPLLLDEMFSDDIAQQLRAKGYDVISVVADPAMVGLPDEQVLAYATTQGRALVTANIKDFVPLDGRYRAAGQSHAGLILVSTKAFPQKPWFPVRDHSLPRHAAQRHGQDPARPGAIPRAGLSPTRVMGCRRSRLVAVDRCRLILLSAVGSLPWMAR